MTRKNIVLIGFMGSGKTQIAKAISAISGFDFCDTDDLIQARMGKSIPDIFEQDGESVFRDMETTICKELITSTKMVIATGGGIVERKENRANLHKIGFVFWLNSSMETILDRVGHSRHRPLMTGENQKERMAALFNQRKEHYEATSDIMISSEDGSVREIANKIWNQYCTF